MGGIDLENSWWYYTSVVEHSWAKCKSVMGLMVFNIDTVKVLGSWFQQVLERRAEI